MRPLFGSDSSIGRTRTPRPGTAGVSANGGPPSERTATSQRLRGASVTQVHPEAYVAAAFAAGVTLAILARRLGR